MESAGATKVAMGICSSSALCRFLKSQNNIGIHAINRETWNENNKYSKTERHRGIYSQMPRRSAQCNPQKPRQVVFVVLSRTYKSKVQSGSQGWSFAIWRQGR